jgi:hypothetical protein
LLLTVKSPATRQTRFDNSLDFPESIAMSYRYPSHVSWIEQSLNQGNTLGRFLLRQISPDRVIAGHPEKGYNGL